ncbi:squamosa promoter-binding protein 15 [Frankia sp. CNm7]|uniref:Squamosa promoter-binding protein 15 n=2 Tax=Frankia nepalensis TaxID=1836974 RepID=A0A937RJ05_9ACTN|nr:hypothetical protein [Frankia nepalensis]MBL7497776.1 squamosa promoter-binding protein 15 [Frankia nepalensis]MBL7511279.1 squamosa promoter-binding protein 15 [Frankia nepalensis]MBL7518298.1 squamosa promoter-binding protein 15 [Frankia nepalensis]MBL7629845.1 hypothetical protein [Frankia nepalensis]
MSWVANVMVSVSFGEDPPNLFAFSEWLRASAPWREEPGRPPGGTGVGFLRPIAWPDGPWGGWKNPEAVLWAGATNHADIGAIVDRFQSTPWREPWAAQLFIQDQEQEYFRLWMLRDGVAVQFAPAPPPDEEG